MPVAQDSQYCFAIIKFAVPSTLFIVGMSLSLKSVARLNQILAKNTGHSVEEIARDTDRNNWMFAEEAQAYGLVDHIIYEDEIV